LTPKELEFIDNRPISEANWLRLRKALQDEIILKFGLPSLIISCKSPYWDKPKINRGAKL